MLFFIFPKNKYYCNSERKKINLKNYKNNGIENKTKST